MTYPERLFQETHVHPAVIKTRLFCCNLVRTWKHALHANGALPTHAACCFRTGVIKRSRDEEQTESALALLFSVWQKASGNTRCKQFIRSRRVQMDRLIRLTSLHHRKVVQVNAGGSCRCWVVVMAALLVVPAAGRFFVASLQPQQGAITRRG